MSVRSVGVWVRVAPGATVDGVSVLIELDDGWVLTGVLTVGLSWDPHAASATAAAAMTTNRFLESRVRISASTPRGECETVRLRAFGLDWCAGVLGTRWR